MGWNELQLDEAGRTGTLWAFKEVAVAHQGTSVGFTGIWTGFCAS